MPKVDNKDVRIREHERIDLLIEIDGYQQMSFSGRPFEVFKAAADYRNSKLKKEDFETAGETIIRIVK